MKLEIEESYWPAADAFLDIDSIVQNSDGRAFCTAFAVCDASGNAATSFYQGQVAHFFYEFEVRDAIDVPSGGLEFHRADGIVVHGKNSFQYDISLPRRLEPGQRMRYHQVIQLDVAPSWYWATIGFASTDVKSYEDYSTGAIGHQQFRALEHCRVIDIASFEVQFAEHGKLRHHGVANLAGECSHAVVDAVPGQTIRVPASRIEERSPPTIVHVTHWKAGSQWIHRILNQCVPELVVTPHLNQSQFLAAPILRGRVYPTVYVTKAQFDRVHLPENTKRFVIVRDLRDTLVSGYFSMKVSHAVVGNELDHLRPFLNQLSEEDGLLYLLENWLPPCAAIQSSWVNAGEPMIRYKDLLNNDSEILEDVLLVRCGLQVEKEKLREAILSCRFEQVTGGRARGMDDIGSHERKGIAGDWRNHFTKRVTQLFKERYGRLLVEGGFERDLTW